jgi:hypothetical protein
MPRTCFNSIVRNGISISVNKIKQEHLLSTSEQQPNSITVHDRPRVVQFNTEWFSGRIPWIYNKDNNRFLFYMKVEAQIKEYINSQPEPKRSDMQELHQRVLRLKPTCKLWFLDGKNSENKTVSNPNIGYGLQTLKYAKGETREFYQIGISANTSGISVYIIGIDDKTYLARTYGKNLGKASVSGYCIKFKALKDIDIPTLEAAIIVGFENGSYGS